MLCFAKSPWKAIPIFRLGRRLLPAACAVIALSCGTILSAQLVQVRPGYIRAPFVRVYTNADGSTQVLAPFVSVNAPPRYYVAPQHSGIAASQSAAGPRQLPDTQNPSPFDDLDWSQLRQVASDSVTRLETSLPASWRNYLKLDSLSEMVADNVDEPLPGQQIEELNEALGRFTATLNSPNMANVTNAAGFRELYGALAELSLTDQQRKMRQLMAAKRQLDRDLSQANAPASWREYLNLPVIGEDGVASDIPSAPSMSANNVALLAAALRRYDQTAVDEQFAKIAELAGFQSTHLRLREYLDFIQDAPSASIPRSVEQLPLPVPDATDVLEPVPE